MLMAFVDILKRRWEIYKKVASDIKKTALILYETLNY